MNEVQVEEKQDLKIALPQWCEKNGLSISQFARDMGYGYQYGWNLLQGKAPVTMSVLGQFVVTYGLDAARELMDMAGIVYAYALPADEQADSQAEPVLVADVQA